MWYLVFSILCSVSVGVILKISRRYFVHIPQIIGWNYVFALLCCYIVFSPDLDEVIIDSSFTIYGLLSILLPSVFVLLAMSIKKIGIVKTDVAQRLSLFIPILASYFIFKEEFSNYKVLGLLVGFPAILLILYKKEERTEKGNWLYPVLVLFGFGVIDILFKQIALFSTIPYTISLFIVFTGALLISCLFILYEIILNKLKLKPINLLFGLAVGCFNFGNILFYLKAHKTFSENPSTVFAGMNIGVIVLGTFAGVLLFKEKINSRNYMGIILAVIAIGLITLSQIFT